MMGEIDLYDVFVPALALWMAVAFALGLPLRRLLSVTGFYRLVWHRPLLDVALYVALLGGVVTLAHRTLQ